MYFKEKLFSSIQIRNSKILQGDGFFIRHTGILSECLVEDETQRTESCL